MFCDVQRQCVDILAEYFKFVRLKRSKSRKRRAEDARDNFTELTSFQPKTNQSLSAVVHISHQITFSEEYRFKY